MAVVSGRVAPVRASWDTQQRLSYNRNAPRKIDNKPAGGLHSLPSSSKPTSVKKKQTTSNTTVQLNVDKLLKFNPVVKNTHKETIDPGETTYLGFERWLPNPPKVEKPRATHNAAALAYIGDCVYELYARRHFLAPALSIEEYNDRVMAVVRCEAQDALLQKLRGQYFLSDEEREVLRWGKNITSSKTRTTKRVGVAVYNRASSLETLIGYLYLSNPKRLDEMMSRMGFTVNVSNQSILDGLDLELINMKLKKETVKVPQLVNNNNKNHNNNNYNNPVKSQPQLVS